MSAIISSVLLLVCALVIRKTKAKDEWIEHLKSIGVLCESKPLKPYQRKALWVNKGGEEKKLEQK